MVRMLVVALLILACSVALAQNVSVTERRTDQPFEINWGAAYKLASHIFAAEWIKSCKPVWCNAYPSPARITTTYGKPIQGDSLTPVDDQPGPDGRGQRPCWVFWKEKGLTGVAIEQGVFGNTIVSTFTILRAAEVRTVTRECIQEVVVERTRYQLVNLPAVIVAPQPFMNPAGVTYSWTRPAPVSVGSVVTGPRRDVISVGVYYVPRIECRDKPEPPDPPDDGTCGPGDPPVDPPPNSGEVNVDPHDPSGQPPGGAPVPPGVGSPPPPPPDNGIITGPDVPSHAPNPDGEHQADPVVPTQQFQPARLVQPSG